MFTTNDSEGNEVQHFENLSEYEAAHPEDFSPIIPISFETAEMIAASGSVEIEELQFDDVVIHSRT